MKKTKIVVFFEIEKIDPFVEILDLAKKLKELLLKKNLQK
jgi:hypothetical protein